MKISRILPVAGILTLLACGAAFAQSNQIPVGAGAGADRQPAGSGWRDPTKSPPAAAQPSSTSAAKRRPAASSSAKDTKATER